MILFVTSVHSQVWTELTVQMLGPACHPTDTETRCYALGARWSGPGPRAGERRCVKLAGLTGSGLSFGSRTHSYSLALLTGEP